jgi:hypothetical protein
VIRFHRLSEGDVVPLSQLRSGFRIEKTRLRRRNVFASSLAIGSLMVSMVVVLTVLSIHVARALPL